MRNCLILGSGRSGTSLVAGSLVGNGYFMGDEPLAASPANPRGYFESTRVNAINERLLAPLLPARPSNPVLAQLLRHRPRKFQRWVCEVRAPLRFEVSPSVEADMRAQLRAPYCLKDPRFSYTLPAWRPFVDDAVFIVVFRHPASTVASITTELARPGAGLDDLRTSERRLYRMWEAMYRAILGFAAGGGRWLFVESSQMFDAAGRARVEAFVEATVDGAQAEAALLHGDGDQGAAPPSSLTLFDELRRLTT